MFNVVIGGGAGVVSITIGRNAPLADEVEDARR
jgi:hypothetical protein